MKLPFGKDLVSYDVQRASCLSLSLLTAVEKLAPKWVVVSLSNHQELFVHSHN